MTYDSNLPLFVSQSLLRSFGTEVNLQYKQVKKISGSFRSQNGAKMFCRIRGFISTMPKQKRNVLDACIALFSGKPKLLLQPE